MLVGNGLAEAFVAPNEIYQDSLGFGHELV